MNIALMMQVQLIPNPISRLPSFQDEISIGHFLYFHCQLTGDAARALMTQRFCLQLTFHHRP